MLQNPIPFAAREAVLGIVTYNECVAVEMISFRFITLSAV